MGFIIALFFIGVVIGLLGMGPGVIFVLVVLLLFAPNEKE